MEAPPRLNHEPDYFLRPLGGASSATYLYLLRKRSAALPGGGRRGKTHLSAAIDSGGGS
jgi:hypothetical protein